MPGFSVCRAFTLIAWPVQTVRAAAQAGRTATMTLIATEAEAETYFFYGYLPGRNYGTDEDEIGFARNPFGRP